jgi:hypothetical protein
MIAEEDTATRIDDLRNALRTALMKTGILGAIRAQLRTSAVEILKGNDNSSDSSSSSILDSIPPHQLPQEGTPDHFALLLVYDFLQHFPSLKRTSGIFAEESGLMIQNGLGGKPSYEESLPIAKELHLTDSFTQQSHQKEPMLVTAVRTMMEGKITTTSSASNNKRSTSPVARESTTLVVPEPRRGSPKTTNDVSSAPSTTAAVVDVTQMANSWLQQSNKNNFAHVSKHLKQQNVDSSKWSKMEKTTEDHNGDDWEEIDVVDKTVNLPNKLADVVSLSVNVISSNPSLTTTQTNQQQLEESSVRSNNSASIKQSSSTTTAAQQPAAAVALPLPLFGNLPSLNTHAKTLAPLPLSSNATTNKPGTLPSLETSNKSSSVVVNQQQHQSSISTTTTGAPANYEDDFENPEDDDDTF